MNTVLAHRERTGTLSRAPGISMAGLLCIGAMLSTGEAQAQDVAAMLPSDGGASLVGRAAASRAAWAPAPAPVLTVERSRLTEGERARLGNDGADPYGRPLTEQSAVTYRWWVGHGASNFGLGVGAAGYLVPAGQGAEAAQAMNYTASVLTVGYRYQVSNHSTLFADASGARKLNADAVDRFSTKVGVEWKASRNKFGIDGASRSLALQLDSGYKMSLRVRKGGVGVYLRGQF